MKLHSYLFIVAIGFSSLASANVIARQQADVSSPATSFAPSTTTSTAISTDTSQDETQPSQTPSVNSTSLASSTAVSSTNTKISLVPSDGAAASPPIGSNKSNATNIYQPGTLPIIPTLTPELGVAGAALILTGLLYGLIGITSHHLHAFLATGFVGSLAIVCLMVFLENTGDPRGKQIAYVLGPIFGGTVIGFFCASFAPRSRVVTPFLAGFCLSMWFMCLKSGGLIPTIVGKTIFILLMSVAGGSTQLFKITREPAQLISIPFTGSTAIILGIDCFARAGLKEFWVYIWSFNMGIFPLHTNTYPLTRGIKIELGCIVIFALLGFVAARDLWRRSKARKNAAKSERRQLALNLDKEAAEVGVRTELTVTRDKELWEKQYGRDGVEISNANKSNRNSKRKSSHSALGRRPGSETIQLATETKSKRESSRTRLASSKPIAEGVDLCSLDPADEVERDRVVSERTSLKIPPTGLAGSSLGSGRSSKVSLFPALMPLPRSSSTATTGSAQSTQSRVDTEKAPRASPVVPAQYPHRSSSGHPKNEVKATTSESRSTAQSSEQKLTEELVESGAQEEENEYRSDHLPLVATVDEEDGLRRSQSSLFSPSRTTPSSPSVRDPSTMPLASPKLSDRDDLKSLSRPSSLSLGIRIKIEDHSSPVRDQVGEIPNSETGAEVLPGSKRESSLEIEAGTNLRASTLQEKSVKPVSFGSLPENEDFAAEERYSTASNTPGYSPTEPHRAHTLLGKRESLIRNGPSSTSFASSANSNQTTPGNTSPSFQYLAQTIYENEDDCLPLSQRKKQLHEQSRRSSLPSTHMDADLSTAERQNQLRQKEMSNSSFQKNNNTSRTSAPLIARNDSLPRRPRLMKRHTTSSRISLQNPLVNLDAHGPQRRSSYSQQEKERKLAEWHASLISIKRTSLAESSHNFHRQSKIREMSLQRRREEQEKIKKENEERAQQAQMFNSSYAQEQHRTRLSELQRMAKTE